jgi:alkanesulfonate monooxygenase SsuD/methylene tetrahydromethanopterin reductase-like flavin-dependent oxidoreductase (luciferase family)
VAKAVGTAAVLSGGRVRLGVAAGWCAEEFAATGQPFANRGQRLSEMIVALRALWQPGWVEHHGRFYDLGPLQMRPVPPEPVPIYVGGHSAPALERAATLGDGFIGAQVFGVEEAVALALQVRALRADAGLPVDGYAIYVAIDRPEDLRAYPMLAEAGVTDVICAPWLVASASEDRTYRSSLAEKVDAAGRFADAVVAEVGR